MSTVNAVFRVVRSKISDVRDDADESLSKFAESVAADARGLAPVRKTYSSQKRTKGIVNPNATGPEDYWLKAPGFTGRRASSRELTDEEYTAMQAAAARTTWRDKSGRIQKGYISPNVAIRQRRRAVGAQDAGNNASSRARVLGTIGSTWQRKTTGARVTKATTYKDSGASRLHHPAKSKVLLETVRTRTPKFKKSRNMAIKVKLRVGSDGRTVVIDSVTQVGQGLLKKMNARQRYDILHGRGLRIVGGKPGGWGGKVVIGGTLRDSIVADRIGDLEYMVIAPVSYAKYVEFGTRYMDAQPFLMPALIKARRRMAKDIAMGMGG